MKQVVRNKIKEIYNVKGENRYTLLVDGNSLLKTSLVSTKLNENGYDYGAIVTFFSIIKKILVMRDFSRCYVFWDGYNSGIMRYRIYPEYKQNRENKSFTEIGVSEYDKQIEEYCKKVLQYSKQNKKDVKREETDDERFEREKSIICQMCDELFIRTYESDEVEGDDLIAFVVHNRKENEKIVIISSDVDLCQLICDDVCIYSMAKKTIITKENFSKIFGYTNENVVLKKIFCGDSSDNIKAIKNLGEKTFFSLFPAAVTNKLSVGDIIDQAKIINEQRAKEKKKPLKSCENIINSVTDGIQGEKVYEINEKIISLDKPMLTEECELFMKDYIDSELDPENRTFENLYNIVSKNKINEWIESDKFGNFFGACNELIYREKHNNSK